MYKDKKSIKQAEQLIKAIEKLGTEHFTKLLIEQWNNEKPHFGGASPHRYDGTETECCYCLKPKDWKPVNAGEFSSQMNYGVLADLLKKNPKRKTS